MPTVPKQISTILQLLRVQHYIKNLFIFLPLFFALEITNLSKLLTSTGAFLFFSLVTSAVYILNDGRDIDADRLHPTKKLRPLASGTISLQKAYVIMSIVLTVGITGLLFLNKHALTIGVCYLFLNLLYSWALKHVPIVDIAIIGVGFVLRLFVGAAVTDVPLSLWIISMTFLLALFLGLAKRRDDVAIFMDSGKKMRPVVDGYNLEFVNAGMTVMASVVIVFYALYTVSQDVVSKLGSDKLYLTTFFVILGVLRYMQLTFVAGTSANPTHILLNDRFLQLTLIGWITLFGIIIYP